MFVGVFAAFSSSRVVVKMSELGNDKIASVEAFDLIAQIPSIFGQAITKAGG